jgi:hypothetical protein
VTRTPPAPLERLAAEAGLSPAELRLHLRTEVERRQLEVKAEIEARRPSRIGRHKGQAPV